MIRNKGKPGRTVAERLDDMSIPEPNSGCLLWVGALCESGYGFFRQGGKNLKAHRVAWAEKHGPIPPGMCVLHKCDTPACLNVDHLFLGSHLDNVSDKCSKGRQTRGTGHGMSKLTPADVQEIRSLAGRVRQVDIARMFRVRQCTVSSVIRGETWKESSTC